MMAEWIEADLVHFVRTPGDYDTALELEAWNVGLARQGRHAELQQAANSLSDEEVEELFESQRNQFLLAYPDEHYRRLIKEHQPDISDAMLDAAIRALQEQAGQ